MRQKILFASGAVCICLVLYFFNSGKQAEQLEPLKDNGRHRLFSFDAGEVSEILISGVQGLHLVKSGRSWWIVEPGTLVADQGEVGRLVSGFAGMEVERRFEAREGLDGFGLERPDLVISVRTTRGWYNLALGSDSPTSEFCYAVVPGKMEVLLLPVKARQVLGVDLFRLRDRRLLHVAPEDIQGLRLVTSRILLDMEKDKSGEWHFPGDQGRRLNAGLINGFIGQLARAEAVDFPDKRIVSGEPNTIIELDSPDSTFRIEIWKQGGKLFCISDIQKENVEIRDSVLKSIPIDSEAVLEKGIVDLGDQEIVKIEISGNPGRLFVRKPAGWYADGRKIGDPGPLFVFLELLSGINWQDRYLLLPRGARKEREIRINRDISPAGFDIILYSQYYVTVGDRVYRISGDDMRALAATTNKLLKENR